jgi:type IV secretory pathway VirB9-like protein
MRNSTIIIAFGALLLAGCAVQQPASTPPMIPASYTPAPAVQVPDDPLDNLPLALRDAYENGSRGPVRDGFAVYLPYEEFRAPIVHAAPEHVTEIVLDPSEKITHATIGDNLRWAIEAEDNHIRLKTCPKGCANINGTINGGGGAQVALSSVPTVYHTNLVVDTNHPRTYHFLLVAGPAASATETLVMWYPEDIATAETARREAIRKATVQAIAPPEQLDCNYTISGPSVAWKPLQACSDSSHEYLLFSSSAPYEGGLPALYVQQNGHQQLVNYHSHTVDGGGVYYVTDTLFTQAALTQGVGNDKEIVNITKQ